MEVFDIFLLICRAIGTSNFSGSLPSELENCTRLEEL